MPNLKSMKVDNTGIQIVASNGKIYNKTKANILAILAIEVKNLATLKTAVINDIKTEIKAILGADMIDESYINMDFNILTGEITLLEVVDGINTETIII